jgi:hypothetical protein
VGATAAAARPERRGVENTATAAPVPLNALPPSHTHTCLSYLASRSANRSRVRGSVAPANRARRAAALRAVRAGSAAAAPMERSRGEREREGGEPRLRADLAAPLRGGRGAAPSPIRAAKNGACLIVVALPVVRRGAAATAAAGTARSCGEREGRETESRGWCVFFSRHRSLFSPPTSLLLHLSASTFSCVHAYAERMSSLFQ